MTGHDDVVAHDVVVDVDAVCQVGPPGDSFTLEARFAAAGGVTVLFGPSGSGKSVAVALIAGLVRPHAGRVILGGVVVADAGAGVHVPTQHRHLGVVFQDPSLLPHRSVVDNVALAVRGGDRSSRRRQAMEALERVDAAVLASRRPRGLSGGEAQRVALARALAGAPRLLLLDEPFTALDAPVRAGLGDLVRSLAGDPGLSVVLVTHDPSEVTAVADRVVPVDRGRMTAAVPVEQWIHRHRPAG